MENNQTFVLFTKILPPTKALKSGFCIFKLACPNYFKKYVKNNGLVSIVFMWQVYGHAQMVFEGLSRYFLVLGHHMLSLYGKLENILRVNIWWQFLFLGHLFFDKYNFRNFNELSMWEGSGPAQQVLHICVESSMACANTHLKERKEEHWRIVRESCAVQHDTYLHVSDLQH